MVNKISKVNLLIYFVFVFICVILTIPFIYFLRLSTCFSITATVVDWFAPLTLNNYVTLLTNTPFPRWMLNSFIVSITVTVLNVFISALAGYYLAYEYKGSKLIMTLTLLTMALPKFFMYVPIYILFSYTNILNTYFSLILPLLANPFSVFLMRQFFLTIPKEYRESAILDGCNHWDIVNKIYVPLAKPAMIMVAVTEFSSSWMEFQLPLLMITSVDMKTVTLGVADYAYGFMEYVNWGILAAGSIFSIIPIVVIFLLFNEAFIRGVSLGIKA